MFATPWIRIENLGETPEPPDPMGDVEIRYQGTEASREVGRINETTVDDVTYRSDRHGYRDRDGTLPPDVVLEGLGTVSRRPEDFVPGAAAVRITFGEREHRWRLEDEQRAGPAATRITPRRGASRGRPEPARGRRR